jgi:signal transduction histidine kinase
MILNSLLHLHFSQEIHQTTNLMLCLLGCSMFINQMSLGLFSSLLVFASWWVVASPMSTDPLFMHYAAGMFTAAFVGTTFLVGVTGQAKALAINEIGLEDRGILLRALSNATDDALVIVNGDSIIGGNDKLTSVTGLSQETLDGLNIKDLFPSTSWDSVGRFLQSSEDGFIETEIKGLNGQLVPMAIKFRRDVIQKNPLLSISFRGAGYNQNLTVSDSTIRTLASGVAHEINNPLTIVSGHLALIQRLAKSNQGELASKILPSLEIIQGGMARVTKTVSSLMKLSTSATAEIRPVSIDDIFSTVLALTKQRFLDSGVVIRSGNAAQGVLVPCRGQEIMTAIIALLDNSLDAVRGQATPEVALNAISDGEQVIIRVIDSGTPIPDKVVTKLFVPFFSTKPPGHGQGLALSVAKKQVAEHGGSLEYVQEAVKTTFEMKVPVWVGPV